VFVPQLPAELAQRIWRNWAKHYTFDAEPDFNLLASRYEITPLQIKQCLDSAHNQTIARGEEHIKTVELPQVCKSSRLKQLPLLGRPANIPFKWEALILPEPIKLTLESVVERIANRGKVFREWGFGEVMPYGQGVTVLLEGHPGTGKTMAAHALAERVGLPMYKIDLSAVMSKYIGETEKNLQALFDEAGETDCVLFFDEAEALFGKRTDVKDSKDKYANLEVSFLLQRLEEHRGLTILATNLAKNFDDAFKRRFQFVIQLPLPDSGQREKIWRSAFPPQTPVSPDIDYNYLAKRYEFSGSGIKNIVLAAAFQAVSQNKPLDMACILNAIEIESAKGGTAPLR
jgi:SpoVK/Ycf46/Vps4 family AAA+-type ATPase